MPFSPPTYAVWVNSLWFLSLAISLTCALLATLLQQWARRYVKITQPRYSPEKRARIRAFFSEGVDKLHLPWAVEALPILLHLSLFLFFAGLLVYLYNVHQTVFSATAWWIGLCMAIYVCITFMPIFRHDSPYYAPLSSSAWCLVSGTLFLLFRTLLNSPLLKYSFRVRFSKLKDHYGRWFLQGLGKITEETARKPSSEMDGRLLTWTFNSLDEDIELERFFSSIPGFCSSTLVEDPLDTFIRPNEDKLLWALIGLMDRTSASHLVPNRVKQRRSAICVKALDAASLPLNEEIFHRIFSEEWNGLLSSVELGLFLKRRVGPNEPYAASYAQSAISIIISREQVRDNHWFELTTGHLGISRPVLRNYLAHGDSVLLANCIHTTRYLIGIYSREGWVHTPGSRSKTLESVTKFDIRRTLPELQQAFCDLWNETVHKAQNPETFHIPPICLLALRHLRNAYISLHQDTDAAPTAFSAYTDIDDPILDEPSSYPLCKIDGHRHRPPVDPTPCITNLTVTATEDAVAVPAALSAVLSPTMIVATDTSSPGPDVLRPSPPSAPNPSGTSTNSVPLCLPPTIPILVPSYPLSPGSHLPDTPTDSAPRIHGVIADAGDITDTSTIFSIANFVSPSIVPDAPSFPTPALSGVSPTNPQLNFPISTDPSTSATALSVIAPQATSISDPQLSTVTTIDGHNAYNLTTHTKPLTRPDMASLPTCDIATEPEPRYHDLGPISKGTGGLGSTTDFP